MKNTAVLLSIILLFQLFTTELFAQQESKETLLSKNTITLNLSRFILNEARFGFERKLSDRDAFRIILGLKYPTGAESFESMQVLFTYPYHFPVSKGVYLGLAYNYVLGVKSRIYVSPEVYYNYNFYDEKYYSHGSGQDVESYTNLQSMKLHKAGFKVLFGKKVKIASNEKMALELDFYAGIGLQSRIEEITTFEYYGYGTTTDYSKLTKYDTPEVDNNNSFYPTLHIGVLMGISY